MKKFILLFLSIPAIGHAADWVFVAEDENTIVSLDKSRLEGNSVWFKIEHRKPIVVNSKSIYYTIQKSEFQCKYKKRKISKGYGYDNNKKVIDVFDSSNMSFEDIIPDSLGEIMLTQACSYLSGNKKDAVKECNQAIKDGIYYEQINSICYNRKLTIDSSSNIFDKFYGKCSKEISLGKISQDDLIKNDIIVKKAIIEKAMREGIEYFCYDERNYYEKILKKYQIKE